MSNRNPRKGAKTSFQDGWFDDVFPHIFPGVPIFYLLGKYTCPISFPYRYIQISPYLFQVSSPFHKKNHNIITSPYISNMLPGFPYLSHITHLFSITCGAWVMAWLSAKLRSRTWNTSAANSFCCSRSWRRRDLHCMICIYIYSGLWFQTFLIFHNILDNPSQLTI